MIRNITYDDKDIKAEIDCLIGKSFSLVERLKMGGNGSPRFTIIDSSFTIRKLIRRSNAIGYCNIELRPAGVLVSFKSVLDTYSWAIPFNKLNVYQEKKHYILHSDIEFVKLVNNYKSNLNKQFIQRLVDLKVKFMQNLSIYN